jgi:hypothetical protein
MPLTCRYVDPPIGIEPMTYALRGTRDLAAHALTAPIAPDIAMMALATLGIFGNPVHKPVHDPWPGRLLLSLGLAVRVAQVNPFADGADGVAVARGGELDQAGALLTGGRCAR